MSIVIKLFGPDPEGKAVIAAYIHEAMKRFGIKVERVSGETPCHGTDPLMRALGENLGLSVKIQEITRRTPIHIDIVFDGPPGHESGRFIEVEDQDGKSINVGQWVKRHDGNWALRIQSGEV